MAAEETEPKIGSGHAAAMFRQGLSELRGALYNESNVAQPGQYGLYGSPVPGEISDAREGAPLDRGEEHVPTVEERLKAAEQERSGREAEPPGIDRE